MSSLLLITSRNNGLTSTCTGIMRYQRIPSRVVPANIAYNNMNISLVARFRSMNSSTTTSSSFFNRSSKILAQPRTTKAAAGGGIATTSSSAYSISTIAVSSYVLEKCWNGLHYCRDSTTTFCDGTDNQDAATTAVRPLASSPFLEENPKLLRRLIRWVQDWLRTFWNGLLLSYRGTQIAVTFCPLVVLTPASIVASSIRPSLGKQLSDATWWYTIHSVQTIGPAFVKLCQWIATRRDIFPRNVCDRLSQLHDNGIPHSWEYTHQILTEAFGPDYRELGLELDATSPIVGCGSAAQVYQGTLVTTTPDKTTKTGKQQRRRPVAVKVLHPNFSKSVERDLWFMQTIAEILHATPFDYLKMLNLPHATENFAFVLRRQADLRIEGNNLQVFRNNFYGPERDNDDESIKSSILFPRPHRGWISSNVLVEDYYHHAEPISNYLDDSSLSDDQLRRQLAGPLLRAFLKMVFLDNFVHGDLHPGNVLVERPSTSTTATTNAKTTNTTPKIIFLDAGIATSLSPDDQQNLKDLFKAIVLNNGNQAGRLMVERAKYERCSKVDGGVDAFASGVEEIVSEFHDRRKAGLTLGTVRIGALLCRVLDLCRVHGVEIDPAMASIVISTLVLEGLGRSLEPELNLIDFALPFILGRGKV